MIACLVIAMIVWSVVAVGAVYEWAAAPLMLAAALLAALAPPETPGSPETRTLDRLLMASVLAAAVQLVPLPAALRGAGAIATWRPSSVSPAVTANAIGLVLAALIVFRTTRTYCARGLMPRVVGAVAFTGLFASLLALVFQTVGDRTLIYGRWHPLDAGAHPFGPFVNRNHFATWVVMACPLALGYVAAAIQAAAAESGVRGTLRAAIEGLGTSAAWVGASTIVMVVTLLISTSRSGAIALAVSLAGAAWLSRRRLTPHTALLGASAALGTAALVAALASLQPILLRLEDALAAGAGPRWRIWWETLRIVHDFPVAGTGLGGYQTAMLVYQQTNRTVFINQAHNQYLHLLAEGGLLVAVPVALTVVEFIRLFRARLAEDASPSFWLRVGGATAILAVAVQGLWETGLRIPANGLLFAVAAAVAVHRAE